MEPQKTFTPHGAPIRNAKLLPVQPPGQVTGRNHELGSMHVTLKIGSSVLLSGPSGIGKSALAAVLATAYTASNPGGVLWFPVVEDDFEMLLARVGRAYGVNALTSPGEEWSINAEIVRALLEKNRPLIVFDGVVDLDASREFVRHCASGTPVIIANELFGAGPWTPINLEPLSDADSETLFSYYYGSHDELHVPDIEGLCKFLGGSPLAIELAARQAAVGEQTPAELLTQLPSSAGQDSQYMMMSVVFKKLPPPVQAMLLVLSATYSGTATAELISDLSNVPAVNIIPLMRQLVTRGIARESVTYGQYAYTLQEAAQLYTRSWLEQYQRLQTSENRGVQAVLAYVERHAHNNPADHDRLAAEMHNIVGAAALATEAGQADVVRQLINLLTQRTGDFVTSRGFQPEIDQMKRIATLLLPTSSEFGEPSPEAQPGLPLDQAIVEPPVDAEATPTVAPMRPVVEPQAEPYSSLEVTQAASPVIDMLASQKAGVEAPYGVKAPPTVERPAPQPVTEAAPAYEAAITEPPPSEEDTDKLTPLSLPTLERQLEDARTSGDTHAQARLLHALGQFYGDQGDYTEAQSYYQQALDLYEMREETDGILATLDALAAITAQADDVENALVYATRGVNLAQQIGDSDRLGRLQIRLADVRLALGDLPAAVEVYTQAAETLRGTENWLLIGMVMSKLGKACLEQAKPQEAIMMLEQALAIFRKERHADHESRTLGTLGVAYAEMQQWSKAQDYREQALTLAREHANQSEEVAQLPALAHLREVQNDRPGAVQYYRQALHMAYVLEDSGLQAEYGFELGRLLIDDTRTLMQAAQLLRESDSLVPNSEARRLLSRADKRLERTNAAGIELPPAEQSNREYAAAAYANAGDVVGSPESSS
jgi:tetratricopeptide (TPR) repeat protein/energy-coupling factor transporter ATP-binding protein EcfA2